MNFINKQNIRLVELRIRDIVGRVVVVRAKVDNNNISLLVGGKVPELRIVTPDLDRTAGSITCVKPLVCLRKGQTSDSGRGMTF